MDYIPNTDKNREEMLKRIGVKDFSQLLSGIPQSILLKEDLKLPSPLSELELAGLLRNLSQENRSADEMISFLGGGAYDHFVPSVVNHILLRSEFYTAYTPYQAEVSQGTLQSIYEFQSLICELTGMDVANASMYDGASATAEAALMSHSSNRKNEIIIPDSLHPAYKKVLETYCSGMGLKIINSSAENGMADLSDLKSSLSSETSCVIVQSPNFYGVIEDVAEIEKLVHSTGALLIMVCDPISLGILKSPGELGVDIAVGEGQGMGNPTNLGGPFLGFFTARKDMVRRLPGRLIAATRDSKDRRGFVMTLQTREQHIRREKATSNICTNEALCALASAVYLSLMGKNGIKEVARLCVQKSHYAMEEITKVNGFKLKYQAPFFKEFIVETPIPPEEIIDRLLDQNILAGVDLSRLDSRLKDLLLVCVTEKRTKKEIDYFVSQLKTLI
ncbi:MAG: aminomethyl-transferring glycine dehydrogenase subunit GcvPA [Candidatus Zixiibacteriota bacterium]